MGSCFSCFSVDKKYDVANFEGKSLFFLGGSRIIGPDYYQFLGSYVAILLPLLVYICIVYVGESPRRVVGMCAVELLDADFVVFGHVLVFLGRGVACSIYGVRLPFLINETSYGWWICGTTMACAAVVLWSMVVVATTDPGIIPRSSTEPFDLYDPNDPIPDRIRTKQVLVNDRPVNLKYCRTSFLFRTATPPSPFHLHENKKGSVSFQERMR